MKDREVIIAKKEVSESEQKRRKYPSLAERFAGYSGDYVSEEWDTGKPVGAEADFTENPPS